MPRLLGPLKDDKGELVLISRRDAADSGRTFFYTGKPCKNGHMSVRYVTNAGCVACLKVQFKPRINPYTTLLIPFSSDKLWTLTDFTKQERVALRVYLQHCIFEFARLHRTGKPPEYLAELGEAMKEIEYRGQFATAEDPRNTD